MHGHLLFPQSPPSHSIKVLSKLSPPRAHSQLKGSCSKKWLVVQGQPYLKQTVMCALQATQKREGPLLGAAPNHHFTKHLTACYSRPVSPGMDLSGGWAEFSQNGRTWSSGKREKVVFWACTEGRAARLWILTQAAVPGFILVEPFWKSKHQVLSSKH